MEDFEGIADGICGFEDEGDHGDVEKEIDDDESGDHFEAERSIIGLKTTFGGPKRGENGERVGNKDRDLNKGR